MTQGRSSRFLCCFVKMDFVMLSLILLLLAGGCVFIYGAGQETGGRLAGYWIRQLCWAGLGLICFAGTCCLDYELLGRLSWVPYTAVTGLLVLVFVPGIGVEINSAKSWIGAGGGTTLQPAELAKPATVLLASWTASRDWIRVDRKQWLISLACLFALPIALISAQPDWGTALIFVPVALLIMFVGGIPWKWILVGTILALSCAPIVYANLGDYQKDRIKTLVMPEHDIKGAGWNAHQSLLAVGSGGKWGKGFMKGTQHVLGFLPRTVAPTDFIFSVIAEEMGFVGAGALVCAFIGIILCCFRAAAAAPDEFGTYLACGVAVILFVHVYINIGMSVRMAPIIGIPLPFVSYGGSFMLSMMICAGLVQNVYINRDRKEQDA